MSAHTAQLGELAAQYDEKQAAARAVLRIPAQIAQRLMNGEDLYGGFVDHAIVVNGAYDAELVKTYQTVEGKLARNAGQLVMARWTEFRKEAERDADPLDWCAARDMYEPDTAISVCVQASGDPVLIPTGWGIMAADSRVARAWHYVCAGERVYCSALNRGADKTGYLELGDPDPGRGSAIDRTIFEPIIINSQRIWRDGRLLELFIGDDEVGAASLSDTEQEALDLIRGKHAEAAA